MSKSNKVPVAWIKVYDSSGNFRSSCVYECDAAVLCAVLGEGSTARNGHSLKNKIWEEGENGVFASDSYDIAEKVMIEKTTPSVTDIVTGESNE